MSRIESSAALVSPVSRHRPSRPYSRWRGDSNSASAGRSRPAARTSTLTRSLMPATTPRSWVTRMIAVPWLSWSDFIRSRIWAWIVTSRAVVGSSASSTLGLQKAHGDHHALASPKLMGVLIEALLGSGIPTSSSLRRAAAGLPAGDALVDLEDLGELAADGQERVQGGHRIWKIIDTSFPRTRRNTGPTSRAASGPQGQRRPRRPRWLGDEPHQREVRDGLARSGLAHEAEVSPSSREKRPVTARTTPWWVSKRTRGSDVERHQLFPHLRVQGVAQTVAEDVEREQRAPMARAGRPQPPVALDRVDDLRAVHREQAQETFGGSTPRPRKLRNASKNMIARIVRVRYTMTIESTLRPW